jgi:hypothetical protein
MIPEREPIEVTLARMQELQETAEPHIPDQHVVSRAILKGFAAPGSNGKGWHLVPFDVRRQIAMKPLGLRGCAKLIDFLAIASSSAELIWKEVEDRIPEAVAVARDGRLHQSEDLAAVAKDCLALHLVRSIRYMNVHAQAVAASVSGFAGRVVDSHTEVFIREFRDRHGGLLPGGRASLEAMVEPYLGNWLELGEKGVIARASIESMFHRVRAAFAPLQLQIWRPPSGKEFLISDSPCLTLRYRDDGRLVEPHVAIGDANTVAMPIGRDCLLALAPEASDCFLVEEAVDLFNTLQMSSAFDYIYYRPGSHLAQWVQGYFNTAHSRSDR